MPKLGLAVQGLAKFADLPARTTLARWISATLEHDAELTLRFVGAAEARRLNRAYRAADYAPDVLTFSYAIKPVVQADLVICVPIVRRAARERHKPFRAHLAHLVVHGVLHALGYEHGRRNATAAMESREIEVLAALGISDPYR